MVPRRVLILVTVALAPGCMLFAQSPTLTPPAPTPIDSTVAAIPDNPTGNAVMWWASVGANGLATYLKWNSSWKQPTDVLHAQTSGVYTGKYYIRGTVFDFGTFALSTGIQYVLCRKFPALQKTFSYVNLGNAGIGFAQFGYNATNH